MAEGGVVYDATNIPAGYDRARDHGPEVLDRWMRAVADAVRGRVAIATILDLGCGTGRFASALADHFDADVLGVDPSLRMLTRAHAKPRSRQVRYGAGRGEALPIGDGGVDLVFISMVFHHFSDPDRVAAECRRVLRAGGTVFLRAGTRDRIDTYPYVLFFPESVPLLHETLAACAQVRAVFEGAGFDTLRQDLLEQRVAATHSEYADKLEAGGDSVLSRLDPADFQAGLARLRAHASRIDPQPVTELIDWFAFGHQAADRQGTGQRRQVW